jgi:hypothetical protein
LTSQLDQLHSKCRKKFNQLPDGTERYSQKRSGRLAGVAMAKGGANSSGLVGRANTWLRPNGFVLCSTPASVRARWGSILAYTEVAIAVAAYWWIALHFDTQRHLWISICIAPLLLLRSRESMARGVRYFTVFVDSRPYEQMTAGEALRTWKLWATLVLSALASGATSYVLYRAWFIDSEGWSLFWRIAVAMWLSLNVGQAIHVAAIRTRGIGLDTIEAAEMPRISGVIAVSAAIQIATTIPALAPLVIVAATAVLMGSNLTAAIASSAGALVALVMSAAIAKAPWSVAALFGFYSGLILRAVLTRFLATLRHLWAGLRAFPANWYQTLFSIDFFYPPELVPGYKGHVFFNFDSLYEDIRSIPGWNEDKLFKSTVLCLLFVPAYLYRLSIKSTFWLYWPLAYVANGAADETRPAVLFDRLAATSLGMLSALVAAVSLGAFVVMNVHITELLPSLRVAVQVAAIEFVFQLDFASQKPWVWFGVLSSGITLVLFLWAGYLRPELKHGPVDDKTMAAISWQAAWMKQLARISRVCSILLILSLLIYYVLWRSPLQCILQEHELYHTLGLLRWYYGAHMPTGPSCGVFI